MRSKQVKFISGDRDLYENFRMKHVIGKGNSVVYEVINDNNSCIECIKEILLPDKITEFIFRKQIELLTKLSMNPHPNITQFKGSYCLQENRNQFKTIKKGYIQMQKGITNLKTYLEHKTQFFGENDIIMFFSHMIEVFAHLQRIQIAHRDIKPSNILIFSELPLFFKVCDVGAGTAVGQYDTTKQMTVIGTPYYLSPELYRAHSQKMVLTNYKAFKSDAYSLGLLFIQFCLLKKFQERLQAQEQRIQESISLIKDNYPNIIGLGKVLRAMLANQPSQRMDFIELQKFIEQHQLLRSKIDPSVQLNPKMIQKVSSLKELKLIGVQQLQQIHALVSTDTKINSLSIFINSYIPMNNSDKIFFEQLKKIKYMKLNQLEIIMQMCSIQDKQIEMISQAIEKNKLLKLLRLNFWNNRITNKSFIMLMGCIENNLMDLKTFELILPYNAICIDKSYEQLFKFSKCKKLQNFSIDLSFNNIKPSSLEIITSNLTSLPLHKLSLKLQSIKTNPIHFNRCMQKLLQAVNVKDLYINASCNCLRDEGTYALADVTINMKYLIKCTFILRKQSTHSYLAAKFLIKVLFSLCVLYPQSIIFIIKQIFSQYCIQLFDQMQYIIIISQFLKSLSFIESSLKSTLKMLKLNFLSNEISVKGFEQGFMFLENLTLLSDLDLNFSNNEMNISGLKCLCNSIQFLKLKKLRFIVDSCKINQKGCKSIGRLISQKNLLQQLKISLKYNQIKKEGIEYICAGLIRIKKIKKIMLNLEGTLIGDYSANYLASTLLKLRNLTNVDLSLDQCNLSEETVRNIFNTVKECSKKTEQISINMRKNQVIRKQLFEEIKKQIHNCKVAIKIDNPNQINEK